MLKSSNGNSDNKDDYRTYTDVVPSISSKATSLVVAASDKAGMDGIDRDRINRIILRESTGTAYMKRQQRQDERTNERIAKLKRRLVDENFDGLKSQLEQQVDSVVSKLVSMRQAQSTKVVLDMDSFYVSAALLSRKELTDFPVCVSGGTVILTSNYCARKYGVRSAMASWIGDTLVRELSNGKSKLIHLNADFELYNRLSSQVRDIIAEYDPKFRAYSLDEAYFDLSSYINLRRLRKLDHQSASKILMEKHKREVKNESDDDVHTYDEEESHEDEISIFLRDIPSIVHEIRMRVLETTGLTCSAGLAPNFMLAKIASDIRKPNGQYCITDSSNESVMTFIRNQKVRKIPGIGRVTEKILHSFGIESAHDLYKERALVQFIFKQQATANFLLRASIGWDDCDESSEDRSFNDGDDIDRKGISRERSFEKRTELSEIRTIMTNIAETLADDMCEKGICARTISLKIKLDTYDIINRSKSLVSGAYIQSSSDMLHILHDMLSTIFREYQAKFVVRLLGIRCSNLVLDGKYRSQKKISNFFGATDRSKSVDENQNVSMVLKKSPEVNKVERVDEDAGVDRTFFAGSLKRKGKSSKNDANRNKQSQMSCPICNKSFNAEENDNLNRHLDTCLNSSLVREAVQEESQNSFGLKRKKTKLVDFFGAA